MTKKQMIETMKNAISPHKLCRTYFKYDDNYWYYFPLIVNEKLFLGIAEDDFILDGYSIRRFRDMVKLQIKDDKCLEILEKEGIIESIKTPNIDITNWKTALLSLQYLDVNVILEHESLE